MLQQRHLVKIWVLLLETNSVLFPLLFETLVFLVVQDSFKLMVLLFLPALWWGYKFIPDLSER